jgi:hypothetical protein
VQTSCSQHLLTCLWTCFVSSHSNRPGRRTLATSPSSDQVSQVGREVEVGSTGAVGRYLYTGTVLPAPVGRRVRSAKPRANNSNKSVCLISPALAPSQMMLSCLPACLPACLSACLRLSVRPCLHVYFLVPSPLLSLPFLYMGVCHVRVSACQIVKSLAG